MNCEGINGWNKNGREKIDVSSVLGNLGFWGEVERLIDWLGDG